MSQPKYRSCLPQLSGDVFLTDGGIETSLIYLEGLELPSFAAFVLLKDDKGRETLRKYFSTYAALAKKYELGLILESATWRASPEWGQKLGYDQATLRTLNQLAVEMLQRIRAEYETPKTRIVISGCIGPRGDGYKADQRMTAEDAETYHGMQVESFEKAGADLVTAITMTYPEEAIGVVWAARSAGLPVVIAFTVETDGKLPSGHTLKEAIQEVDEATDQGPAYYMINCAHPTHFAEALQTPEPWAQRIRGIRVNASKMSHAELDKATELDAGNPAELGSQCVRLQAGSRLNVLGGCCGTDERHIEEIAKAVLSPAAS